MEFTVKRKLSQTQTIKQDPLIGTIVGGCKIEKLIGRGGMGAVYKAENVNLGQPVALKVMSTKLVTDESYVQRFMREARVAAQLAHPNVVRAYDVGEDQGYYFIIMEFIDGPSVRQVIRQRGRIAPQEALGWALQVAKGLDAAHRLNMIHRDIKPHNLLLTKDGVVKISDFGLAKSLSSGTQITQSGMVMGTPEYMSPEQCNGEKVDIRADIYSLGATLFEMLIGKPPYDGDSLVAVMTKQLREPVPDLRKYPDIPPALAPLIEKMMAKKADDRYQTPAETIQAIEGVLAKLQGEKKETAPPAAAKPKTRTVPKPSVEQKPSAEPAPLPSKEPEPPKAPEAPKPVKKPKPEASPKPAIPQPSAEEMAAAKDRIRQLRLAKQKKNKMTLIVISTVLFIAFIGLIVAFVMTSKKRPAAPTTEGAASATGSEATPEQSPTLPSAVPGSETPPTPAPATTPVTPSTPPATSPDASGAPPAKADAPK